MNGPARVIQAVALSQKLDDARRLMQHVHGEEWPALALKVWPTLRGVMSEHKLPALEAALALAKASSDNEHAQLLVLAATVEFIDAGEPQPTDSKKLARERAWNPRRKLTWTRKKLERWQKAINALGQAWNASRK
jgi:hypothetical protein